METVEGTRQSAFEHVFRLAEEKRLQLHLFPVKTCRLADYGKAMKGLLEKGSSHHVKLAFDFR